MFWKKSVSTVTETFETAEKDYVLVEMTVLSDS